MGLAVIVAWPDDKLAGAVTEIMNGRDRCWVWLPPATLASVNATIVDGRLSIDDKVADAILWRASPQADLATDFATEDHLFANIEARAFWLAALNLPTLASTFRPDPALFFARSGWLYWREVLARNGVPLAPMRHGGEPGAAWMPYAANEPVAAPSNVACRMLGAPTVAIENWTSIAFASGVPAAGEPAPAPTAAALQVLSRTGLGLGTLIVSDVGVLCVDATPRFDDPEVIRALLPPLMCSLNDAVDFR